MSSGLIVAIALSILGTRLVFMWVWRKHDMPILRSWLSWAVPFLALVALIAVAGRENQELRKLIGVLIVPTGLLWLGLIAGAGRAWWLHQWRVAALLTVAVVVYTVAGNVWLGSWLLTRLELRYPEVDIATCQPFDVVVVLGGGTAATPSGRAQLASDGDRVLVAARLYFAHKTPLLVASGSTAPALGISRDHAADTDEIWRTLGIPATAIMQEADAHITADEIALYKKLRDHYGWKRIGVVTSAWHLPRALAIAKRMQLELQPIPAAYVGASRPRGFTPIYLVPQIGGFVTLHLALWERLGTWADG